MFIADFSHQNPNVKDWAALKEKVDGVILKLGEGETEQDPMYVIRLKKAAEVDLKVEGGYFFYHPGDDPNKQADNAIQNSYGIKVIVVDLEWTETQGEWGQQSEEVNQSNLRTFIARLEAENITIKIYSSHSFITQYLPNADWLAKYDLWVADYVQSHTEPLLPSMWTTYWAWQFTASATFDCVEGPFDMSRLAS